MLTNSAKIGKSRGESASTARSSGSSYQQSTPSPSAFIPRIPGHCTRLFLRSQPLSAVQKADLFACYIPPTPNDPFFFPEQCSRLFLSPYLSSICKTSEYRELRVTSICPSRGSNFFTLSRLTVGERVWKSEKARSLCGPPRFTRNGLFISGTLVRSERRDSARNEQTHFLLEISLIERHSVAAAHFPPMLGIRTREFVSRI